MKIVRYWDDGLDVVKGGHMSNLPDLSREGEREREKRLSGHLSTVCRPKVARNCAYFSCRLILISLFSNHILSFLLAQSLTLYFHLLTLKQIPFSTILCQDYLRI